MGSPSGVNLDSPPPPSTNPSPTLGGLAGQGGPQPGAGQAGGSTQIVMEHMMEVEKLLGKIADIKPEAAPIVDNIVQQMRARLGKALMQDSSQSPAPAAGASPIAGLMASPAPTTPMS